MDLYDYITAIASSYDSNTLHSPGHELLKAAPDQLIDLVPAGLIVKSGGGQGVATYTPWVAVLDPDETESPLRGIYVVYLFSRDLMSVYLTINQGITRISREHGDSEARRLLIKEAKELRALVPALAERPNSIELMDNGRSARGYQAGTIAAIKYSIAELPDSATLETDLWDFIALQQLAVTEKRNALQLHPGLFRSPSSPNAVGADPLANFHPKSSEAYLQYLAGKTLVKSRRHELLIDQYGKHVASLGYVPITAKAHPRDLLLRKDGVEWLVEAKVLYNGNATHAVREALGQLAMYEYIIHNKSALKLALFTEPIDDLYVEFLEHLEIASVWKTADGWAGSSTALAHVLY